MKTVKDEKLLAHWLEKSGIADCFSTPGLRFSLRRYDKGEPVTVPGRKMEELLFVVEGTVRIYGIRSNGSISPVNQQSAPLLLGDMELFGQGETPFFTDAVTPLSCLVLPVEKHREQLEQDVPFLHMLLRSCSDKLRLFAFVDVPAETIEERVLLYLEQVCPSHELKGIEAAVLQLRCSRRQLQRVLAKLCASGEIEKLGKGHYRLAGGKGRR